VRQIVTRCVVCRARDVRIHFGPRLAETSSIGSFRSLRERACQSKQEHLRLKFAITCATNGVEELVRLLPRAEAELFEPELAILSVGLGVDALSTATGQFARVKRALRDVSLHDCLEMASAVLK
jgi:hypothetical protein